jgi:hypothetical protein
VKFLDPAKPNWQQALALELLHRLTVQPGLLREFCRSYDCRPHATNIFQVRLCYGFLLAENSAA